MKHLLKLLMLIMLLYPTLGYADIAPSRDSEEGCAQMSLQSELSPLLLVVLLGMISKRTRQKC